MFSAAKSSKCNSPHFSQSSNTVTQDLIPTRFVEVRQTSRPPMRRPQSYGRKTSNSNYPHTEIQMEPYIEKVSTWNSSVVYYAEEGESHSGATANPPFRYSKRPLSGKRRQSQYTDNSAVYTPKKVLSYCSVSPFQNPFIVRGTVEQGAMTNFVPRNNLPSSTRNDQ